MTPAAPEPAEPARGRDLAWTSSTYFAEGLPWSILHQVAGEFLTAVGVSATAVGRTSYLHAGTSFKVLWSPLVDLLGTLRGWMVGTQLAMGIVMGFLAVAASRLSDGGGAQWAIWVALGTISFLSATHDIACDGYYMDALGKTGQARYSGVRVAAFRFAMLVGSSGLVFLGGRVGWLWGFGVAAGLMLALALGHHLWLPEGAGAARRRAERAAASGRARWEHVRQAYLSFLRQERAAAVLAFLVFYKMSDAVMFSMSKVLLARTLGVTTDLRGIINSVSIGAAIAGAMLGGAWIARRSLARTLLPITLLMALTQPLYATMAQLAPQLALSDPSLAQSMADIDLAAVWPRLALIASVVVVEQLCGGLATAAQMVFIMRRCHPDHKAAHFAFATAVYSTAQMLVGGESGTVYDAVGPVGYFWIASALALPAIALVRLVPKD